MIGRTLRNVVLAVGRLRRNDEAVAAVEFALIVPFLITLYFGSIEAAALYAVDKRVDSISSTIGDLFAQWDPEDGKISTGSTSTWTNYINASTGIMSPYSTSGLKIVVSFVQVKKCPQQFDHREIGCRLAIGHRRRFKHAPLGGDVMIEKLAQ